MFTKLIDDISNQFQNSENLPVAFDQFQKQSLISTNAFEKTAYELLLDNYELGMVLGCLLYHWLKLSAAISNLDENEVNRSNITVASLCCRRKNQ